jgi:hypothetical protein
MNGVLQMSNLTTLKDSASVISSLELAAGVSPCDLLDGPMTDLFGREVVRARRFPLRERKSTALNAKAETYFRILTAPEYLPAVSAGTNGPLTRDTFGRNFIGSSATAALQSSLANRSRARTDLSGSPEYELRWKSWDMALGPKINALRASARRMSDNAFTGWPTPKVQNGNGTRTDHRTDLQTAAQLTGWPTPEAGNFGAMNVERLEQRRAECKARHGNNGFGLTLGQAVAMHLSGWPTPMAGTPAQNGNNAAGNNDYSRRVTGLAGWATPHTPRENDSDATALAYYPSKKQVGIEHQAHGLITGSSSAETGSRAAYRLNPLFSLWLMGFPPAEWASCGARAMQSSRKSRRNS